VTIFEFVRMTHMNNHIKSKSLKFAGPVFLTWLLLGATFTSLKAEEAKEVKQPVYLGIVTKSVSSDLRSQLGIPAGTGLVVRQVQEGSPAAKAGLQTHDVLLRFDEQILVNSEQLRVLVRSRKDGDSVDLDILRGGKAQKVKAILREAPQEDRPFWNFWKTDPSSPPPPPPAPDAPQSSKESPPPPSPKAQEPQFWDNFFEGIFEQDETRISLNLEELENSLEAMKKRVEDWRENLGKQNAPAFFETIAANAGEKIVLHIENQRFYYKDPEGSVLVNLKDGRRHLRVVDASGEKLFNGFWDGNNAVSLPPSVQERLEFVQEETSVDWSSIGSGQ
jgi:hypothetical protein